MIKRMFLLFIALLVPCLVLAQGDRTVKFTYKENQVYPITLYVGYATQIVVGGNEVIQMPIFGHEKMFAVAKPSLNTLTLKPTIPMGNTNLLLTTQVGGKTRNYAFHLSVKACADVCGNDVTDMVWQVQFDYGAVERVEKQRTERERRIVMTKEVPKQPSAEPPSTALAKSAPLPIASTPPPRPLFASCDVESGVNLKYYANKDGNKRLMPTAVCDNGTFTRIEFSQDQQWPAPYRVNLITGDEQLLNFRQEGSALILEGVYEAFVLRYGQALVCIFNGTKVQASEATTINTVKILTGDQISLNESAPVPLQASILTTSSTPLVEPDLAVKETKLPDPSAKPESAVTQSVTPTQQTKSQTPAITQLKGRVYDPSRK